MIDSPEGHTQSYTQEEEMRAATEKIMLDVISEARLNQLLVDMQREFNNLRYLIRTGQILWK